MFPVLVQCPLVLSTRNQDPHDVQIELTHVPLRIPVRLNARLAVQHVVQEHDCLVGGAQADVTQPTAPPAHRLRLDRHQTLHQLRAVLAAVQFDVLPCEDQGVHALDVHFIVYVDESYVVVQKGFFVRLDYQFRFWIDWSH